MQLSDYVPLLRDLLSELIHEIPVVLHGLQVHHLDDVSDADLEWLINMIIEVLHPTPFSS